MTSSEQARADAMADAETLRRFLLREHGLNAADDIRLASNGQVVMLHPEEAARAAFRAVPGLRG